MKKLHYILLLPAVMGTLSLLTTACSDNSDYSTMHVLTDGELAEMHRQDSLDSVRRSQINVDLLLKYDVDITISAKNYDGGKVVIDAAAIAETFGITEEEFNKAILGDGGPNVTGFAIEGTTHADNMTASTSGSPWGHWWKADGTVTKWGDNSAVFAEYGEDNTFTVGQMPGVLTDGQTVTILECAKYQDKRVGVQITIHAKAAGEITAGEVGVQQLSVGVAPKTDYSTISVPFDLQKALTDLGVESLAGAKWVGVNADGSYAQEYTADGVGFWYDKSGYVGSWGETASVFTGYSEDTPDQILIGQMPDGLQPGESVTVKYGVMVGNKIEMMHITVTIEAYQDPETAPAGDPESMTRDITFTKAYDNEYKQASVYDAKEELRQAFKMTTYQIFQALKSGEMKVYLQELTEEDPKYTGSAAGEYWMDAEGKAAEYADGVIYGGLYTTETTCEINFGNHPDNCSPTGQQVATKLIISCKGVTVTYVVNVSITAQ